LVHEKYPEHYKKPQDRWWNGYTGQKDVILEDFDKMGTGLSHLLKIWSDRYHCTGETKGGVIALQHERFIITSNYKPEDLWEDRTLVEAIRRRFKVIEVIKPLI